MELYWTLLAWKELNLRIWEISQACLKTYSTEDGMWNHYTTTKSSISLGGCFISRKTTSQVPKSTCPCQTANHQLSLSLWAIQMANVSMFQRLYLIFQTRWFSSTTARITNSIWELFQCPLKNIISGHKFHGLRNPFLRNIASMPILASRNRKLFKT